MNYILNPSLEHIALVKVTAILWNPRDIRDMMKKFCIPLRGRELRKRWLEIENIIQGKVPQLPLPELLKKKTLAIIRPIGFQLLNWIEYHCDKLCFNIGIPDEFYWIPRGAIDKKKMAEMLIRDEGMDITIRYKLACIYCLEESVRELWKKIPKDRRISFYNAKDPIYVMQQDLVILWTYDIKGKVSKLYNMFQIMSNRRCSPYQYAFEYAASIGNGVATEYFLQKLNISERKEALIKAAGSVATGRLKYGDELFLKEYYSDVLCVLLSQMNEEQQVELFKSHSYHVLKYLLDWPRQIFFMKTVGRMWNFLPAEVYEVLLRNIIDKLKDGCKDFNYQKLFGEVWQQSPNAHKEYILNYYTIDYFLSVLFKIRDENNIKLIFQDATSAFKNTLIYNLNGIDICEDLIEGEEWSLLELFIQECLISKDEVLKFKENFTNSWHYMFFRNNLEKKKKYDKFFHLLDDFISEFSKRKHVAEEECDVKKLCNNL